MKLLKSGFVTSAAEDSGVFAGWQVELCHDPANTKGYFLFYANPDKSVGYDDWFLNEDDAHYQLKCDQISVEWQDIDPSAKPTLTNLETK